MSIQQYEQLADLFLMQTRARITAGDDRDFPGTGHLSQALL